jgi:hypothetical protein
VSAPSVARWCGRVLQAALLRRVTWLSIKRSGRGHEGVAHRRWRTAQHGRRTHCSIGARGAPASAAASSFRDVSPLSAALRSGEAAASTRLLLTVVAEDSCSPERRRPMRKAAEDQDAALLLTSANVASRCAARTSGDVAADGARVSGEDRSECGKAAAGPARLLSAGGVTRPLTRSRAADWTSMSIDSNEPLMGSVPLDPPSDAHDPVGSDWASFSDCALSHVSRHECGRLNRFGRADARPAVAIKGFAVRTRLVKLLWSLRSAAAACGGGEIVVARRRVPAGSCAERPL